MAEETIIQHWIFTQFALPFLLIFFIVYGVLSKSKVLGEGKQLNALVAFVIGLIFVTAISPKLVVSNMILFLTVALVVMFVALLLWGFIAEGKEGVNFKDAPKALKWLIGIAIVVAVFFGLLWAMGQEQTFLGNVSDFLFRQSWSNTFWTNVAFVAVILIALVVILKAPKS